MCKPISGRDIDEGLGSTINIGIGGLDGSVHYFKYRNDNPNLPAEEVIYDGTGTIPTMAISFNQDGLPMRYVAADGTTFFVSGYNDNMCNGLLLTPDGNDYPIDDILIDIQQGVYNFTYEFAQSWAKAIINKAIEKALSGQIPDAEIILEALQGTFESKVQKTIVSVMPNEIKYLFSCLSFAKSLANPITIHSCMFAGEVTPYAFVGGVVGGLAVGVLWGVCLYQLY